MKQSHLLLLMLFAGCSKITSISDQVRYHDDGVVKPKVAVIKVIDTCPHNLDWDLSSEFTEYLLEQLFARSKFYLTDDFQMITKDQLKKLELSPFSEDMSWLLEMNSNAEFVLFTEILDHKIESQPHSNYNPLKSLKTLNISLRVCVLDIRKNTPKVVLQEIISKQYTIAFNLGSYSEDGSALSKNTFALSPLGLAHKNILAEIVKEAEDYILIAQSNLY
jgi:hypothetical protein